MNPLCQHDLALSRYLQGDNGVSIAGDQPRSSFNWRKKYAGMLLDEMRRLRALEEENTQLNKTGADLTLDQKMLLDVIRRNLWACP